jgi:imidazolonepropionase-like amidohydrolase
MQSEAKSMEMREQILRQHDEWLAKHLDELIDRHPGKIVAIQDGKIVKVGDTYQEVYQAFINLIQDSGN